MEIQSPEPKLEYHNTMTYTLPLTIATPVLNGMPFIKRALESVAEQKIQPVEHLIFDAGSTDGTQNVVRQFSHSTLIEEPDSGAHEAMNKALEIAKGDWIVFLNADDRFLPSAFEIFSRVISENQDKEMLLGGSQVCILRPDGMTGARLIVRQPRSDQASDLVHLTLGVPSLNSRIFRTDILNKFNGFDNNFYISADRDLLLRMTIGGIKSACFPEIIFEYGLHKGSQTLMATKDVSRKINEEHLLIASNLIKKNNANRFCLKVLKDWRAYEKFKRYCFEKKPAALFMLAFFPPLWRSLYRKKMLSRSEKRLHGVKKVLKYIP